MSSGAVPRNQTKDPLLGQLKTMLDIVLFGEKQLVALKLGEKCLTQD